jgi:hypothetical protein
MHKTMIVVAASPALGTATIATATIAFARGGGVAHRGGAGAASLVVAAILRGGGHVGRGFGDGFGRRFGFGGEGFYYGYGYSGGYVLKPSGYAWVC